MSKELEALKNIANEISNYKLHGIGNENWLGIQDVMQDIDILEKALTPPTADEVCKELGEWFGREISFHNNIFYIEECFNDNEVLHIKYNPIGIFWKINNAYETIIPLPLRLIKRIAMFYEKESERE